jgi:hypothetical protein
MNTSIKYKRLTKAKIIIDEYIAAHLSNGEIELQASSRPNAHEAYLNIYKNTPINVLESCSACEDKARYWDVEYGEAFCEKHHEIMLKRFEEMKR